MARSFQVNIITPEKVAFEENAVSIVLPGTEGYLGAWAHHAPLVTGVVPGVVWLKVNDAGEERYFAVTGGFCEISNNTVNLMVDACDPASEIDIAAAKEELAAARQQIQAATSGEDVDDLHAEIARQEARVRAVERSRQR